MNTKNFVFLICSERSGSNLVSALMNSHSRVQSPPPYHLCRDIGLNLHTTLGFGPDSEIWANLMQHCAQRIGKFKSGSTVKKFQQWLASKGPSVDILSVLTYVYTELDLSNTASTVFIKENNMHRMLFFILQYFPQAKFVFQVRDPRDFLASAMSIKKGWMKNKFGSNYHAMEVWRDDQLGGLAAMAHLGPDRVFLQRYEDLVMDPESVLSSLCGFLDLDFEPEMLDFYKTKEVIQLAKSASPRENIAKPLMSGNFGKYRKELSKEQIVMVETYLGALMKRFGYTKDYPEVEPSLNNILTAQMSEVLERYINGACEPFYTDGLDLNNMADPLTFSYNKNR